MLVLFPGCESEFICETPFSWCWNCAEEPTLLKKNLLSLKFVSIFVYSNRAFWFKLFSLTGYSNQIKHMISSVN